MDKDVVKGQERYTCIDYDAHQADPGLDILAIGAKLKVVLDRDRNAEGCDQERLLQDSDPIVPEQLLARRIPVFFDELNALEGCEKDPNEDLGQLQEDEKDERSHIVDEKECFDAQHLEFLIHWICWDQLQLVVDEIVDRKEVKGCNLGYLVQEHTSVCWHFRLYQREQDDDLQGSDHSEDLLQAKGSDEIEN